MNFYPESFKELVNQFKKMTGIGEKTAERYVTYLSNYKNEELADFIKALENFKKIGKCINCGCLSDKDYCEICEDNSRNKNLIMIVENYSSVIGFEKSGNYNGIYHIIGDLISPIDGVIPENLNIKTLVTKVKDNSDIEVIIALKPTIEGETTTLYIKKILSNYNVKITRLSYGIPTNIEIGNLDSTTLFRAINDRKNLE